MKGRVVDRAATDRPILLQVLDSCSQPEMSFPETTFGTCLTSDASQPDASGSMDSPKGSPWALM